MCVRPFATTKAHIAALLSAAFLLCFSSISWAEQIIDLAPARAPDATAIARLLQHSAQPVALSTQHGVQGAEHSAPPALRILNMPVDHEETPTIDLDLQPSRSVTAQTQFFVTDETGEHPLQVELGMRYTGTVQGEPDSSAFVSIRPDGSIRSIVHMDGETIVNEYQPGSRTTVSATTSRVVNVNTDFTGRRFQCGVTDESMSMSMLQGENFATPISLFPDPVSSPPMARAGADRRRADVIVETDAEFLRLFGNNKNRASDYIDELFAYISQVYEREISTRLNIIAIRFDNSNRWSSRNNDGLLDQLTKYWEDRPQVRHHVHLLSGKKTGGGLMRSRYLFNSNGVPTKFEFYGVSGDMDGDFSPANPQLVWDSLVVAHEIGHAFTSPHTHTYDFKNTGSYFISTQGGAIDCCHSEARGQQCVSYLGGVGRAGPLPGYNSLTGGRPGQKTGTIMSYCDNLAGGLQNIAWTFGTNHPYGINPGRVPQAMTAYAKRFLPLDSGGTNTFTLTVNKIGNGTVNGSPGNIQCGSRCSANYNAGTRVTLTATADNGYVFSGWSGACSGSGSCSVTMNSTQKVNATFTRGYTEDDYCFARPFSATENRLLEAYIAYYGRAADTSGLLYWTNQMNRAGGKIEFIVDAFGNSEEFRANFAHMSRSQLVNNLYQQMFARNAEPDGLNYYVNELSSGRKTLPSIALAIMAGASGTDATTLKNRRTVAQHYVTVVEFLKAKNAPEDLLSLLIDIVGESQRSVNDACKAVIDYYD